MVLVGMLPVGWNNTGMTNLHGCFEFNVMSTEAVPYTPTALPRNEFQCPCLHQRYLKVKPKLFIETNNIRDECALQSSMVSAYYARTTCWYPEQVGIHFLKGQEKLPKVHQLEPIDEFLGLKGTCTWRVGSNSAEYLAATLDQPDMYRESFIRMQPTTMLQSPSETCLICYLSPATCTHL